MPVLPANTVMMTSLLHSNTKIAGGVEIVKKKKKIIEKFNTDRDFVVSRAFLRIVADLPSASLRSLYLARKVLTLRENNFLKEGFKNEKFKGISGNVGFAGCVFISRHGVV
jgi:hypothetical protein